MSLIGISKRAGVSKSTVSRVINGETNVSADAVKRVREAIRQSGYHPENRKRSGRRRVFGGKTDVGNVGVLVLGQSLAEMETHRSGSYWKTIEALGRHLGNLKRNLLLFSENDLGRLSTSPLDGLFILGWAERLPEKLRQASSIMPGIILSSQCFDPDFACDRVAVNHASVGALAARYLLDRGHIRVAIYNPYRKYRLHEDAAIRFAETCVDRGIQPIMIVDDLEATVSFPEKVRILGRRLAESAPEGVFVTYSERALELYPVLREYGIEPVKNLDVVTYTNVGFESPDAGVLSAWVEPNYELVAKKGLEQLLWRRDNMNEVNRITILIEPYTKAGAS
jgi:DNA-binding LacI/PurR family transcriptional regulator